VKDEKRGRMLREEKESFFHLITALSSRWERFDCARRTLAPLPLRGLRSREAPSSQRQHFIGGANGTHLGATLDAPWTYVLAGGFQVVDNYPCCILARTLLMLLQGVSPHMGVSWDAKPAFLRKLWFASPSLLVRIWFASLFR